MPKNSSFFGVKKSGKSEIFYFLPSIMISYAWASVWFILLRFTCSETPDLSGLNLVVVVGCFNVLFEWSDKVFLKIVFRISRNLKKFLYIFKTLFTELQVIKKLLSMLLKGMKVFFFWESEYDKHFWGLNQALFQNTI